MHHGVTELGDIKNGWPGRSNHPVTGWSMSRKAVRKLVAMSGTRGVRMKPQRMVRQRFRRWRPSSWRFKCRQTSRTITRPASADDRPPSRQAVLSRIIAEAVHGDGNAESRVDRRYPKAKPSSSFRVGNGTTFEARRRRHQRRWCRSRRQPDWPCRRAGASKGSSQHQPKSTRSPGSRGRDAAVPKPPTGCRAYDGSG